jgi:hypothetical protein
MKTQRLARHLLRAGATGYEKRGQNQGEMSCGEHGFSRNVAATGIAKPLDAWINLNPSNDHYLLLSRPRAAGAIAASQAPHQPLRLQAIVMGAQEP